MQTAATSTPSTKTPGQAPSSDPDALYEAWKAAPSPNALRAVVDAHDSTISSALKSYAPGQADNPVAKQKARLLAAEAIRGYRSGGDASLKTHIHSQLQSLRRIAPRISDPMPKPERLAIETSQIEGKRVELADRLGREPSVDELANFGGYEIKKLRRAMSRNHATVPESNLDVDGSDDNEEVMPGVKSKSVEAVWADYVYHDLSDVDKVVFQHRVGYRGAPVLSNQEIARRLRLSPGAVSQRVTRLTGKLNELYGTSGRAAL